MAMTTLEFLSQLRRAGIKLRPEGGQLRFSAPQGALTDELRAELVQRKAEILKFLEQAATSPADSRPAIAPAPRNGELPVSFAQQRLWFLNQLEPDAPFYNIAGGLRLKGELNIAALERTLSEILRRHEALRTTFADADGRPVQVIHPPQPMNLPVADLSSREAAEREMEIQRLGRKEARLKFDLARGPLFHAQLLRCGPADHVLLYAMHHIVSDGWSMGVFVRELMALYEAFAQDKPSPLPELPVQYADFARWQREWLSGERLAKHLDYWKEHLAGAPPVLNLPISRSRPPMQAYDGATIWHPLPRPLTDALQSLARDEQATLFMVLFAAFNSVLHRYSNAEDIVLGSPIAGRNQSEIENLIGFFVNTLVLRTKVEGNPTFRELLARVKESSLGAYAHQDLPFEKLVEELHPARSLSHGPLFQVSFVLQNMPRETVKLPGLTAERLIIDAGTSKFDMELAVWQNGPDFNCSLEFNTALFDRDAMTRLLGHFQTLLEGVVADPDARLSDLPLLTGAERKQFADWNDTAVDYPHDVRLHWLIEAQVERTPTAPAVVFEDRQLTYRELNARANQLAHFLQKRGVKADTLVGICVERSLEMVIGLLGILKAGGAYVPIDPSYPKDRLAFMLEDANVGVVLTQQHLLESLPPHEAETICLDSGWETIAKESSEKPPERAPADSLAYMIYTSGSTGKPKGAMNEHRGIVNRLLWMQDQYRLTPADSVLQKTPFSFDVSVWEFFWPLLTGARLVVAVPGGHQDPAYLVKLICDRNITVMHFVPSILRVFIEEPGVERCRSLREVICSGEALPFDLQQTFFERLPANLENLYGPTEAAVDVTYWACQRESARNIVPIGRPVANTQTYILDARQQPVPVGVPGELHLGGAQVGRGYHNRPELTAEKFIPDPFSKEPGARLYKTGDLARFLPDGNIEYLGRIDHQVKIRGFRIELGEIEAVLAQHPDIKDVVVVAREDRPGDKRLAAYVVPENPPGPAVAELRDHLKDKLPEYMVPAHFVIMERLPLSPNGKVDRKALPAPDVAKPETSESYVAPRTPAEQLLADIWKELLRVERVGIHDNFFELGGDSILTIQILARARQAGLQFTPRQFFQHQTIAELAAIAPAAASASTTEQGPVRGEAPLTPVQRWFFEHDLENPDHWNQAFLLELRERPDAAALQQAVEQLLVHHDALRLRFDREGNGWRQFFTEPEVAASAPPVFQKITSAADAGLSEGFMRGVGNAAAPFLIFDLSAVSDGERGEAITGVATKLQASLNLSSGPLLRVVWLDLGADQPGRLLFAVHHLAVDGVSWRILLEDLEAAYLALLEGKTAQLPARTASFKAWAEKLVAHANTDRRNDELDFWLAQTAADGDLLPFDAEPRGPNSEASAQTVVTALESSETQALLQKVPPVYNTQINDVLLAALAMAFRQTTGAEEILLCLEGHGREEIGEDVDVSRTVGWFTAMFPVRLAIDGAAGPGQILTTIKETLRRVPDRGVGYGLLRYLSNDESVRQRVRSLPQPQLAFNYFGQFDQMLAGSSLFDFAAESVGPWRSPRAQRVNILEVNARVLGGRLEVRWTYSANLHQRSAVEGLAQNYLAALRGIIAHCQTPGVGGYTPSDFPEAKLSADDLDELIRGLSAAP